MATYEELLLRRLYNLEVLLNQLLHNTLPENGGGYPEGETAPFELPTSLGTYSEIEAAGKGVTCTCVEAAKMLGITAQTVSRWCSKGLLPHRVVETPSGIRRRPYLSDVLRRQELRKGLLTGVGDHGR